MLSTARKLLSRGTMQSAAMLGRRLRKDVVRDFLDSSYRIWGTRYDYSIVDLKHPNVPVRIVCKQHGVYHVSPRDHLHKQRGCPDCSTADRVRKERTQSLLPPCPNVGEIMKELAPGRRLLNPIPPKAIKQD